MALGTWKEDNQENAALQNEFAAQQNPSGLTPTDFTRSEYDNLFRQWQESRSDWIDAYDEANPENFGNVNGAVRAQFEREVYGQIPTSNGSFGTTFEVDPESLMTEAFLSQWQEGAEATRIEMEIEVGLRHPDGSLVADPNNKIAITASKASAIPAATVTLNSTTALRYPSHGNQPIDTDSDYVTFQFFTYAPPFRRRTRTSTDGGSAGQGLVVSQVDYNQNSYDKSGKATEDNQYAKNNGMPSIIMYMPEDISTGFKANWTGKAFTNVGTSILQSAGAEGTLDKLADAAKGSFEAVDRMLPLAAASVIRKTVQKVGGDTLSNDDIFGGISGAILNPNVELMYGGADLRNFSLKYKLVPRDVNETQQINQILNTFKKAMLPKLDPGAVMGGTSPGTFKGFIGVPDLCRVAFMKGSKEHPRLPRYKMCAITAVDVNYTPDGAYATYKDGQPVAVELTLSFQETKMVFSEEIGGYGLSEGVETNGIR